MTRDKREQVEHEIKVEQEIDKDNDELSEEDLDEVAGGTLPDLLGGLSGVML